MLSQASVEVMVTMAKKNCCSLLRRFFIAETVSKLGKKKRKRWAFGKFKIKRLASVSTPSLSREGPPSEAEQEQNNHAVTMANATAAAEVVQLTQSADQSEQEKQEFSTIKNQANATKSPHQCEKEIQDLAATKIQTAFRGYLARKALRALKGLVRLQAIIRGRAVRRQAITTLKCLQSVVNIQSQVCARRCQKVEGTWYFDDNKDLQEYKVKIDSNSQRRWDDRILSKDEADAVFLSKREAIIKRERIKEFLSSHRRSAESEQNKLNGRWRYWLEQWVDTQLSKNPETVFPSNARIREELGGQTKLRNTHKVYGVEELNSPISAPRRSFHHKKQHSMGENNGLGSSLIVPTYMAATESARAKARSMSSPRLRAINLDAYSETNSPYKHKLSPISSIKSEVTQNAHYLQIGSGFQQRSPCLKGLPGRVKSNRILKDLSFDSECSLPPNWDRNGTFR